MKIEFCSHSEIYDCVHRQKIDSESLDKGPKSICSEREREDDEVELVSKSDAVCRHRRKIESRNGKGFIAPTAGAQPNHASPYPYSAEGP